MTTENPDNPDRNDQGGCQADVSPAQAHQGDEKRVRVRSLVGIFLWAVLLVVAFQFFDAVQFVVLCGLGAAVLAAALQPLADAFKGPRALRSVLAISVVLLLAGGALVAMGWMMYGPIKKNIERAPQIRYRANEGLQDLAASVGINGELTIEELAGIASNVLTGGSVGRWVSDVAGTVLTGLLAVLVVVVGAAFLLARPAGSLSKPASKVLPPERQAPTCQAIAELQAQYRWWLIGTLFSMLVVGVVFGVGYVLVGLEFALPLALFAGLAQVVPTFGPMVTLLLSLLIAATQGWVQIGGVLIVYFVAQTVESYFLTPMVMRKAVNIPPIVTLFTIILWGNILGAAGLILAIPIDLTIWAFCKQHIIRDHDGQAHAVEAS